MLNTKLRVICILVFILLFSQVLNAAEIAIVKSYNLTNYNTLITGFSVNIKANFTEYDMKNNADMGKEIFKKIKSTKPDLIIAIGPSAAAMGRREIDDIPIIFTMVPNIQKYDLTADNITGISLQLPIKTQLKTLMTIAPQTKSVGVMYNPKFSTPIIQTAFADAQSLGLQLIPAKVDSPNDVPSATRAFLGTVDALWMIADKTVLTTKSFRTLLEFTAKHKIPFFSFSAKLVEAGALVSLSPNYAGMGQQAATIAKKIIVDRISPKLIPVSPPSTLAIALNLTTAKRIGVECNIALEVFTFAAEHDYPIKVYK